MKHLRRNILMLLAALFLALLCTVPVMAQEAVATAEPQPVVTQPAPDGNITVSAFELLGIVVTAVLSGSLTTVAGVVAFIRAFRDPEKMALIEGLYNSQPVERKTPIRKGVELLKESAEILDEATDGVPAVSKVVASSTVMTDKPMGFVSMGDTGGTNLVITATPVSSWKSTSAGHIWTLPEGATLVSGDSEDDTDDPHPTPEKP